MPTISNILIANRGEIAMRIIRTAHALGYSTVAVYSDADARMPHVLAADRAVPLGPAPADQSYLNIPRIIDAALRAGADAVHPGYGFLSESAAFAQACEDAGLVFIGPNAQAISGMADKAEAKRLMLEAGVPCIPGYDGPDQGLERMQAEASRLGYPVMVKAVAGGGGKGIRLVTEPGQFPEALTLARSEAEKAFGNGAIMLEKAILDPRHVEVQVFADMHGNAIHIGDRDCSVQRRHQKVIEEAPAPGLSDELRRVMGETAVQAALAIHYRGAGTVEFLVDRSENFYFLEMNTRLQVEHPVTEMVSGLDLVELQIRIASGEPLPCSQDQILLGGHSIEARLYAEDPQNNFLPQSGRITAWRIPEGEGIRVDHGLRAGMEISHHYDPMIAKLITHGRTREEARRRMLRALDHFLVGGIANNRNFLRACLSHPEFIDARLSTAFIERNIVLPATEAAPSAEAIAVAAVLLRERAPASFAPALRDWRSNPWEDEPLALRVDEWTGTVRLRRDGAGFLVINGEATHSVRLVETNEETARISLDGVEETAFSVIHAGELDLMLRGMRHSASLMADYESGGPEQGSSAARAPMPGLIVAVHAVAGELVQKGHVLMVMEAMKMELVITAQASGRISAVHCSAGQQVPLKYLLVEIEPGNELDNAQETRSCAQPTLPAD